jgi:hypothetical protein
VVKRLPLVLGLLLVSRPALAQDDWTPAPRHTGVHVSIGRNYTLPRGDIASGPVVVIGGTAIIDGHAEDDVVVIGGALRVGPTAEIDGDATAVAGNVAIDPMARVHGDTRKLGVDWRRVVWPWDGWRWGAGAWRAAAVTWTTARLVLTLFVSLLLTLIFPRSIGGVAHRIEAAPGASFVFGFLAQVLFVPALVVLILALIITIVGIPLLAAVPAVVALFAGLWIAGFAAASATLGASLRGVIAPRLEPRLGDVLVGFVVLTGCTMVGQVMMLGPWMGLIGGAVRALGACIEYLAWTIGLGAALMALFARRRGDLPPPLPTPATSATVWPR